MIVFLSLIYVAVLAVLVKLKFVRLTLWWKLSPLVWMLLLFVGLFLPMQFWAPAGQAVVGQYSVPIVPNVAGQVVEVSVEPNQSLQKGDLLFRIDPVPYEAARDQIKAQLELAQLRLQDGQSLLKTKSVSEALVEQYEAQVKRFSAALKSAEYNLQQTRVVAPSDGFATNLALRVGARVTTLPLAPAMAFVESDERIVGLQIPQAYLRYVQPGQEVELTFKIFPGQVAQGKVEQVVMATSQGQLSVSGNMITPTQVSAVPYVVRVVMQDEALLQRLPAGAVAEAAIYTEHGRSTHIIRRVMLRMTAWLNYVVPV